MYGLKKDWLNELVKALILVGMAACCLLLVLLPANTILAQFVGAAVALCGLFSLVLSRVFARAVAYKEENDLTV